MHRKTAEITLRGHDLTVVGTYDEAQKALEARVDHKKRKKLLPMLLKKAGLTEDFYRNSEDANAADKQKYEQVLEVACDLATNYPDFDVVMTDLLVPAPAQQMGVKGSEYIGKQMPLGTIIALLALANGVKYVAVVTDESHHHHPASAAFDCFRNGKARNRNILCTNHIGSYVYTDTLTGKVVPWEFLNTPEGKQTYKRPEGRSLDECEGITLIEGKNWGEILEALLESKDITTTP